MIINVTISTHSIDDIESDRFKIKKTELIKINRTKLVPKLLIFLTLGIVILSFSTTVQGATTIRPIDDYAGEYTVFFSVDLPGSFIGWGDPDSGLVIHPHAVEWLNPLGVPIPGFPQLN